MSGYYLMKITVICFILKITRFNCFCKVFFAYFDCYHHMHDSPQYNIKNQQKIDIHIRSQQDITCPKKYRD